MAQPLYAGKKLFLTQTDLAKYPFTPQAAEHVQELDHRITELGSQEYTEILEIAERRVNEAIDKKEVGFPLIRNSEIELLSFPVAVMMVASSNDKSLKRRYALAEAKRAYALLQQEDRKKLVAVGRLFKWKIKPTENYIDNLEATISGFSLDFISYLKNATVFHESKWKLVNRNMLRGEVFLTSNEVARLISEEVRANIEEKLDLKIDIGLPLTLIDKVEKLKHLYNSLRKIHEEKMPKEVMIDAFPPCINKLYNTALTKQHLSHIERFTLTSFLLNSGMTIENVIECFRPTSDFREKMTRYQVEHIAGGKGSRTKYNPPSCSTLRTHRICPGGDEICQKVRHPLGYYREKYRVARHSTQARDAQV